MKSLLLAKLILVCISGALILVALAIVPMPGEPRSRASVSMMLERSPEQVWDLVSDLEAASHYLPDIERIEILGGSDRGVGASRRLFTSQSDWLDATVLEWDEGRGLVLQLHRGDQAPFPFANASFEYTMQALSAEATAVHLSLVYLPRYGLLGQLLDSMFLGDRAEQQVMAVAKGLKRYSNADQ